MMTLFELPLGLADRLILVRVATHPSAASLVYEFLASQRGCIIVSAASGTATIDSKFAFLGGTLVLIRRFSALFRPVILKA